MKNHDQTWYEFQGFFFHFILPIFLTFSMLSIFCTKQDDAFHMISRSTLERELAAKEKEVCTSKTFCTSTYFEPIHKSPLVKQSLRFPMKTATISDYSCSFQILFSSPDRSVGGGYPTSASSYEQDTRGRNTSGTVCFTVSQC